MSNYFEDNRGLLCEIKDLARGGMRYASFVMDADNPDTAFCLALFTVINGNADAILNLFDDIETIPGIGNIRAGHRPPCMDIIKAGIKR